MNRFVLDASVALAWALEDEASRKADSILDRMMSHQALTPAHWPVEVANALLAGERRKRIKPAGISAHLALLGKLRIQVESAGTDSGGLITLARACGLSVYDAAYLSLALHQGVPLATLDQALGRAAKRAGVELLDD